MKATLLTFFAGFVLGVIFFSWVGKLLTLLLIVVVGLGVLYWLRMERAAR